MSELESVLDETIFEPRHIKLPNIALLIYEYVLDGLEHIHLFYYNSARSHDVCHNLQEIITNSTTGDELMNAMNEHTNHTVYLNLLKYFLNDFLDTILMCSDQNDITNITNYLHIGFLSMCSLIDFDKLNKIKLSKIKVLATNHIMGQYLSLVYIPDVFKYHVNEFPSNVIEGPNLCSIKIVNSFKKFYKDGNKKIRYPSWYYQTKPTTYVWY